MTLIGPDYAFNGAEAHTLARRIRDFWWRKGHLVEVEVKSITDSAIGMRHPFWVIRSDMIDGLPRAEWTRRQKKETLK